jgi:two-component system C4-dicarboxylate transport response regulator DctD
MQDKSPVVFIDDEKHIRIANGQTLELAGYQMQAFDCAEAALPLISHDWPGVIVSDMKMPGMSGMEFLEQTLAIDRDLPVILITGHGDIAMAVQAIRQGAYDFIEKPFGADQLVETVRRALDKRALTLENRSLRQELQAQSAPGPRIIGNTPAMQRLRATIAQLADTDADILIHGETGTGKELVARSLHEHSRRADHNFVAVNCGAVPENLIESELFGHEPGAFTGAKGRRVGRFEHADHGTLFLDEIESMPMQVECFEKSLIKQQLELRKGNLKKTMEALGVPRKTLYDKMRKYGLDKRHYK